MAKKWGQISLPRLLRETEEAKQERNRVVNRVVLVFVIIAAFFILEGVLWYLSPISVSFSPIVFAPSPSSAYEFKTGVNPPQEISNLIKHGPVVLYFTMNDCPPCDNMTPKIADLQSQYKGTDVTFVTFNVDDNATSRSIAQNYGIDAVPRVFVIRADGAVAKIDYYNGMDFNAIKSAIADAQNWQQSHPT